MTERRKWHGFLGLIGLVILMLGLTACSSPSEPAEDPQLSAQQGRNITVYESPT